MGRSDAGKADRDGHDEAADAHGERLLRLAIELGGQRLPELDGPRVSVEALLVGRGAGLRLLPVQELVLEAHAVARKPRAKPVASHSGSSSRGRQSQEAAEGGQLQLTETLKSLQS